MIAWLLMPGMVGWGIGLATGLFVGFVAGVKFCAWAKDQEEADRRPGHPK